MLILDDIVYYTRDKMTSVAYSYMTLDAVAHGGVPGNRKSSAYPIQHSRDSSVTSGGFSRNNSSRKRKKKKSESKNKVKVQICVQFFKVGEIDTLKEQFTADVIVKAKWREPTLDGQNKTSESIEFNKLWNPKLYIENSLGDPKEQIRYRLLYNDKGEAFVTEKRVIKGTFMENLELDDFPFDVQDLTITVASELPSYEVELIEDLDDHHVVNKQSFVDEQEWHLYMHTECSRRDLVIDQADNSVRRSALSVKCRAARRPGYFVWNIFLVTFLICTLAFATFSVKKTLPQNRLQLSFTLVLTAVAFKSVVNSSLPRISYLTYMDKYLLAAMIMLSAVCVWHALVTVVQETIADRAETIVLIALGVIYVIYNVGFLIIIYLYPWKKRRTMAQKDRDYTLEKSGLGRRKLPVLLRQAGRTSAGEEQTIRRGTDSDRGLSELVTSHQHSVVDLHAISSTIDTHRYQNESL
ncbi:cys-loop ligand-gated ion channel-like isoform X2 [Ostrea edulis]|uniref:cys-loop ligand-gated ion channel-like isoform X2 n=1 Tax=Ostrea edulis TaxID=37623 RepID=UPI002094A587|nr:cys-loop ligand-gated ion channel-like isoform X2 [Ostrea edulis]